MKKNMGSIDQSIRIVAAITISLIYGLGYVEGLSGIILLAMAVMLIITASFSNCPFYRILGVSTCTSKQETPYFRKEQA